MSARIHACTQLMIKYEHSDMITDPCAHVPVTSLISHPDSHESLRCVSTRIKLQHHHALLLAHKRTCIDKCIHTFKQMHIPAQALQEDNVR